MSCISVKVRGFVKLEFREPQRSNALYGEIYCEPRSLNIGKVSVLVNIAVAD